MKRYSSLSLFSCLTSCVMLLMLFACSSGSKLKEKELDFPRTVVSIDGNQFLINGIPTYAGRNWQGYPIEGLLFNSRMVQGIFDDENPETQQTFIYPDTKKWDAERNTDEFVAAMETWRAHGLLGITLNLQGGSPIGYGNKDWKNTAFDEKGALKPAFTNRLEKIIDRADQLGMVVILGYFYFGQDQNLENEAAILRATDLASAWLIKKGYRNVLIEVNNECNVRKYDHEILTPHRVHELIQRVKAKSTPEYPFWVGTSYGGGAIPDSNVVENSDYILLHGNGVKDPAYIKEMVALTKAVNGYINQPIVFNEDDHYDFDQPMNNMVAATQAYASWGYFDFRRKGEAYEEGFQSVPVDWGIHSERKKGFFEAVKEITGGL